LDFAKCRAACPLGGGFVAWTSLGWSDGSISLLVYQIGARFLGHRALALVLQCCVAVKA
jgi:hypothetical protein